MGLESLLARLEGRFVSPVSPEKRPVIQENRLQNNAVSPVSPVSRKRSGDKPESGLDVDTPASAVPPSWAVVPPTPADPLWGRVAITEPGGRTVEVDTPLGWTLADWQAYAERYHGSACALTPIAGLPKPRAPVNLDEALRAACDGVAGITPTRFRALLSPQDVEDIEAGAIHPKTLHAYAQSFAEGIRSGRIAVIPGRTP